MMAGRYYVDKSRPEGGFYEIEERDGEFRFHWQEVARGVTYDDYGTWEPSRECALLQAADDWDGAGDGSKRLSGLLTALAKRASRSGDPS